MFGAEKYTNEELKQIIIERLAKCERIQLEWAAAIVSVDLPTGKELAKVYPFARAEAH